MNATAAMLTKDSKTEIALAMLRMQGNSVLIGRRRLASQKVLDSLVALQCYLGKQLGETLDPPTVRAGIQSLLATPHMGELLVACNDRSQIMGQIEVKKIFEVWDNAPYWYLDNYVVFPQFQGIGIGMAMMDYVKGLASQCGVKRIRLYVAHDNPGAKAFYVRNGMSSHGDLMEFTLAGDNHGLSPGQDFLFDKGVAGKNA